MVGNGESGEEGKCGREGTSVGVSFWAWRSPLPPPSAHTCCHPGSAMTGQGRRLCLCSSSQAPARSPSQCMGLAGVKLCGVGGDSESRRAAWPRRSHGWDRAGGAVVLSSIPNGVFAGDTHVSGWEAEKDLIPPPALGVQSERLEHGAPNEPSQYDGSVSPPANH